METQDGSAPSSSAGEDETACWICHEPDLPTRPLTRPCRCMPAHRACLARWQLQSAGKAEEKMCRFCGADLPDWRGCWSTLPKADPVMTVAHDGQTHQVVVRPGLEGRAAFERTIREIFGLSENDTVSLTFGCALPQGVDTGAAGSDVTLSGWESFDAAVFCASLSAGQRQMRKAAAMAAADPAPVVSGAPASAPLRRPAASGLRRALGRCCDAILG
ncbi:hypothetical protein ACKKBF_B17220 [Auxenochlorella protothecoides x Auxenochlorella symbiontica]